ncbi:MAG: hypothetical protein U9N46_14310 [Euryarchaeota archaeon]|nr:hypothetical protein [Euryarchaeota archaeon]
MNNRTTILVLSVVLIAAVLSGCVQETSEIGEPQSNVTPPTATPDADQPASASETTSLHISAGPEITNWKYVSYRNLSISNAPALNQTARITFSIIPDRDIEILLIHVSFLDGFEFVDVEGDRLLTWGKDKTPYPNLERCARWCPTNLLKDEMYQFSATIKAVKTGNWTITGLDWENEVYISVSKDSAYIRDEPFTVHSASIFVTGKSVPMTDEMRAEMEAYEYEPSDYNISPSPVDLDSVRLFEEWWESTGKNLSAMQNGS